MRSLVLVSLLVTVVASCKDSGTTFTFDSGPAGDAAPKTDASGDTLGGTDAQKVDAGGDTLDAADAPKADAGADTLGAADGGNDAGSDLVALDAGADLSSTDAPADLPSTSDGAGDSAATGDAE